MIQNPTITVFMAVYNTASYLSEAIESILSQTFSDFELLIINDGSTDNSEDILKKYTDPRIRVLNNETNRGLYFTRWRGVQEAKGAFFAILDSDDIAMPERLAVQYEYMTHNPDVAMCGTGTVLINSKGEVTEESSHLPGDQNVLMVFQNVLTNSSVMMRTEIVRKLGSYREYDPAEDYDLALRIAEKFRIANLDEVLVKYRIHETNTSYNNTEKLFRSLIGIVADMHARLGIPKNEKLIKAHSSYFTGNESGLTVSDYYKLFTGLKAANERLKIYNSEELAKLLFKKWYEVIIKKGGKDTLALLFTRELFKYSYITFKQLRRSFKRSVKSLI